VGGWEINLLIDEWKETETVFVADFGKKMANGERNEFRGKALPRLFPEP
jgi:hypothetical protein